MRAAHGPSELERWQHQLSHGASRGGLASTSSSSNVAETAMKLLDTLAQLRSEPDGLELYSLNDKANDLMRRLPRSHSARRSAEDQGVVLPGREGYFYFGRCASLPYVREAGRFLGASWALPDSVQNSGAERKADSQLTEAQPETVHETREEPQRSIFTLLAQRHATGCRSVTRAVRGAVVVLEEQREALRVRLETKAAAAKQAAAEWQERLDTAKRRRTDNEAAPQGAACMEGIQVLGAQDPLAYLSDDSSQ
eukprot:TRINITY_DN45088_c0_g1_i1.p1 TRINITY_DN45088_c0_g1~~TRINITY_DN45088_c0_g1_i1.p1  ORF type:complete len:253 (-),score=46.53 TRINITY_DN45088_c0_g1_i1:66-824(-)